METDTLDKQNTSEGWSDALTCSAVRVLFKAAVSGLWYAARGAAGSINAVWVDGNVQSSPTCIECQEETELEGDEWKCTECGWTKESSLPNADVLAPAGDKTLNP